MTITYGWNSCAPINNYSLISSVKAQTRRSTVWVVWCCRSGWYNEAWGAVRRSRKREWQVLTTKFTSTSSHVGAKALSLEQTNLQYATCAALWRLLRLDSDRASFLNDQQREGDALDLCLCRSVSNSGSECGVASTLKELPSINITRKGAVLILGISFAL